MRAFPARGRKEGFMKSNVCPAFTEPRSRNRFVQPLKVRVDMPHACCLYRLLAFCYNVSVTLFRTLNARGL